MSVGGHCTGQAGPHHTYTYHTPPILSLLPAAHLDISLSLISSPLCHMTRLVITVPISLVAPAAVAETAQGGGGDELVPHS